MPVASVSPNSRWPPGSAYTLPRRSSSPSCARTESPCTKMPQLLTRNSPPVSCDPSTELPLQIGSQHDYPTIRLHGAEAEDLRPERPDLPRREVRHRNHVATEQFLLRVPALDCRGRLPDAERPEIDLQPVRGIAGLGEVLHVQDLPDTHLHFLEILEGNRRHALLGAERAPA